MNPPITECAIRLRDATSINRRAVRNGAAMYAEARGILARAIAFTPEEALAKAEAALAALLTTRKTQVAAAWRSARTAGSAKRAELRILALYEAERIKLEAEIESCKAAFEQTY